LALAPRPQWSIVPTYYLGHEWWSYTFMHPHTFMALCLIN
jgi:hypothetical protein